MNNILGIGLVALNLKNLPIREAHGRQLPSPDAATVDGKEMFIAVKP